MSACSFFLHSLHLYVHRTEISLVNNLSEFKKSQSLSLCGGKVELDLKSITKCGYLKRGSLVESKRPNAINLPQQPSHLTVHAMEDSPPAALLSPDCQPQTNRSSTAAQGTQHAAKSSSCSATRGVTSRITSIQSGILSKGVGRQKGKWHLSPSLIPVSLRRTAPTTCARHLFFPRIKLS